MQVLWQLVVLNHTAEDGLLLASRHVACSITTAFATILMMKGAPALFLAFNSLLMSARVLVTGA